MKKNIIFIMLIVLLSLHGLKADISQYWFSISASMKASDNVSFGLFAQQRHNLPKEKMILMLYDFSISYFGLLRQ